MTIDPCKLEQHNQILGKERLKSVKARLHCQTSVRFSRLCSSNLEFEEASITAFDVFRVSVLLENTNTNFESNSLLLFRVL